jgi:filamentous hemagglutinin family protein
MNHRCHRLVFSRRRGMLVAVTEHASARGKAAGGESRGGRAAAAALLAVTAALGSAPLQAQTQTPARAPVVFASQVGVKAPLPVPYGRTTLTDPKTGRPTPLNTTPRVFAYDPAKGPNSADLSLSGAVGWSVSADGKTGTFNQGSVDRVVLNWDSFDIGAGYKVHFAQNTDPSRYVSALNRIWSADPSVILGALTADREVILLNANGVYFGRGAQVDTGKFIATANSIADSVFEKGLRNVIDGSAVFSTAGTDYQPTNLNAAISVEAGAEIRSAAGGDVLLIAPRVVNRGRIDTPQGQTVLAAGDKVYLMSSSDPKQRGLIVAIDPVLLADGRTPDATLGIVENAATGGTDGLVNKVNEIHADSGTVNLVGLTVKQTGQINATTAVKGANGAIYLQAMSTTTGLAGGATSNDPSFNLRGLSVDAGSTVRVGNDGGQVLIGAGSTTAVRPSTETSTQLDAEVFNPSVIRVEGKVISVATNAHIEAPAGKIDLLANLNANGAAQVNDGSSRLVVAPGAVINAAGLRDVLVDGSRNQGAQRLFRVELANAPVQRSSPLYRSQVYFDVRDNGKITTANVTGSAAAITRTASEKSTSGGTVNIVTDGDLVIGESAQVDVSGGSIKVSEAIIQNTLLSQNNRVISFRSAIAGNTVSSLETATQKVVSPAYTEGAAGGTLTLDAQRLALNGQLQGSVVTGDLQRDGRSSAAARASLVIGSRDVNNYTLAGIELLAGAPPALDAALFVDPLQPSLPGLSNTTGLSLPRLRDSSFGSVALRAAHIRQPVFGTLDLGIGGTLDLQAQTIELNGAFTAAGGALSVVTPVGCATTP